MSRARFTQKDIERALSGAKEAGMDIEVRIEGSRMRILPHSGSADDETPDGAFARWQQEELLRKRRAKR